MSADLALPVPLVFGFILVLARVAGAVSFVPVPGFRNAPATARAVLALSLAVALLPLWPRVDLSGLHPGEFGMWLLAEGAFGITVGLAVAFLNEAFVLASQIFGLQAGYGYASTIDPATEADSSVLQLLAHLAAGLLFFAIGLDREVIRLFAASLESYPPGTFLLTLSSAEAILGLGAGMFAVAVRLALPVVTLLVLVDLSLALLSRIDAQLQLLTLAFPAKMLVSMALLAALAVLLPALYRSAAGAMLRALRSVFGLGG